MQKTPIDIFYDQQVENLVPEANGFLGHFDMLFWKDLQKDITACEKLQRKPFYKIALIDGDATYYSNDHIFQVSGKNIVFINPITRCGFLTADLDFDAKYCVFTEGFVQGAGRISINNLPVFRDRNIFVKALTDDAYHDLGNLFKELSDEHRSTYPFKEQVIRNRIFDVIHYTQKLNPDFQYFQTDESLEDRFLHLLDSEFASIDTVNPLKEKSPAYFANLLNCTVGRLNRAMKKMTGKTTHDIIHERLVMEANILLRHSSYSMKEIAWSLDFNETSHFLNFYKRKTGITPSAFRSK
jgi:AraC family transcriptional activator of pobA